MKTLNPPDIEILLHYYTNASPYSGSAGSGSYVVLVKHGFLIESEGTPNYKITERGAVHAEAICCVPLPVYVTPWHEAAS